MAMLRLTKLFSFVAAAACSALLSAAFAVDPPPDGGYPNGNTAEGTSALLFLGTGANNTALGCTALQNNSIGDYNTATGANALSLNFSGSSKTANGFNALGPPRYPGGALGPIMSARPTPPSATLRLPSTRLVAATLPSELMPSPITRPPWTTRPLACPPFSVTQRA